MEITKIDDSSIEITKTETVQIADLQAQIEASKTLISKWQQEKAHYDDLIAAEQAKIDEWGSHIQDAANVGVADAVTAMAAVAATEGPAQP